MRGFDFMSASSKKKLRKEANALLMTEKQQKEQAEAKKLKVHTIIFVAVLLAIVITAVTVMTIKTVNSSGVLQKNTVALTVNDTDYNAVELGYYYVDMVNSQYQNWQASYGNYLDMALMASGLDVTKPLDEQVADVDGTTWADHFLQLAIDQCTDDHVLYEKAIEAGMTLSEEDQKELDYLMEQHQYVALMSGYTDMDTYLAASYGFGADAESYRKYCEKSFLAEAYFNQMVESFTYTDEDLRAEEEKSYVDYSSFTFNSYFLANTRFLEGGTEVDGKKTYTEEEEQAAQASAKAAAESLLSATTVEQLDKMIADLDINADLEAAASTKNTDKLYTTIREELRDWLADDSRKAGDITVVEGKATSTDENGNETTYVNGYYVLLFQERDDNLEPLANVRHLLVKFQNGKTDSVTGVTTYADEDIAAAKEEAEKLLAQWKAGEATQDSFIELVKEHSDDTSAETGGLFEDITPASNYVEEFLNWSIDPDREAGDVDIIKTQYGYHIMFYVGDDELTYRDYMITNTLKNRDVDAWYEELLKPVVAIVGNTKYIKTDLVLGTQSQLF